VQFWEVFRWFWTVAEKIEELTTLQKRMDRSLREIDDRLRLLENRIIHLEADRSQLVTEARAAAGVAGTNMASIIVSDVVTRITRLEMRHDDLQKRLPPP